MPGHFREPPRRRRAPMSLGVWLVGGALAGAATYTAYNATSPTAQGFGPTFAGTPGGGSRVALTFDDGPHPVWTPALLQVLDRHGVAATSS